MGNFLQILLKINFHKCLVNVDGDPSQTCIVAWRVMESYRVKQISIPARSPDINTTEFFFNFMSSKLQQDAIEKNITYETFEQFSEPILTSITSYPLREIDKIIESMRKRKKMIVKNKGERLKYQNLCLQDIHFTRICR